MISFTSITPVGGKISPRLPRIPDDEDYTQRPLGGLITPPKEPRRRNPNPSRPIGGLITPPRTPKHPGKYPTRPIGGLVTPKPERHELPDIFYPDRKSEKAEKRNNVLRAVVYTAGLALAVALGAKYSDKIKNVIPEIKNRIPEKIKNIPEKIKNFITKK